MEPAQSDEDVPTQKRILFVEDDNALANVYVVRLEAEGFKIRRVNNGEDALEAALEFHPDLVLLDIMLPKLNGLDVLNIFRNTPETTELKVIILTALGQPSDVARAKELGVNEYIIKSQVVISDVVTQIRSMLDV